MSVTLGHNRSSCSYLLISRYQGHVGAALVLGGVDPTGPHLFTIAPHGSTDKLPYVTMGSGSLAAMAVFESYWRANMSVSFTHHFVWCYLAHSVASHSVPMLSSSSKTPSLLVSSMIWDLVPMSTRVSSLQTTLRCSETSRCLTRGYRRSGLMCLREERRLGRRRISRSWCYQRR